MDIKIIQGKNLAELETKLKTITGVDLKGEIHMIENGNVYAVLVPTSASPLSVTENGTYNEGPYGSVTVAVPNEVQEKEVSIATLVAGGTIEPDEGYIGISKITLTE